MAVTFPTAPVRSFEPWRWIKANAMSIIVIGLIIFLVFVPISRLLISSFQLGHPAFPDGWTLSNYESAFAAENFYVTLARTFWIAAVGTAISLTLAVMLASLLVVNVVRVRQTIPANFLLVGNFNDRDYWVCWPGISAEFAQAWAAYYALDDEVAGCRAAARCNPATWQLPYTEGRPAWHPPGQQVC